MIFSASALAELELWPYETMGRSAVFMNRGYTYSPRDTREFSQMSAGAPLSRLMSKNLIVDHVGALELKQDELSYFEWWYYNKINYGNDYFKIQLMTATGYNTVVAKFAKNGKGQVSKTGITYKLTCKLIAMQLFGVTLTEQQIAQLTHIGVINTQAVSSELDEIVNGAW